MFEASTIDAVMIRPYKKEDAEDLYLAARESIYEVHPWLPWCHPDYSRKESEQWIARCDEAWKKGVEFHFVITHTATGRFLGGVGINQINITHRYANLGYWVRSSETGKGVTTAAAILAARFGFQKLNLGRIEILVARENKASLRVAEKTGARREGVLRNRLIVNDHVMDAVLYALIPEDLSD